MNLKVAKQKLLKNVLVTEKNYSSKSILLLYTTAAPNSLQKSAETGFALV